VGSVVITKMDGHAKGGGALSAVAATQSPIIFVGTGEHVHDLDPFEPRRFIHRMLGMGDILSLTETIQKAVPDDAQQQQDMMERIADGLFTLRDMYDQYTNILKMGPLGKGLYSVVCFVV
jgi:signal recognition particle subunit SRP54